MSSFLRVGGAEMLSQLSLIPGQEELNKKGK